jgi:hypothetical protein
MQKIWESLFVSLTKGIDNGKSIMAFFLILCVVCSAELSAQGCSDAGACSIYGDHTGADTSSYHQIAVGMSSGKADNDIIVWGTVS